jgi:hypothetical protein
MGETRNILQSPSSGLSNFRPEFFKSEFDQAIQAKGYDVEIMRALRCPCHGKESALPDCQNCFGTGYFYVNAIHTKALITGINFTDKYKSWSQELLGTMAVTVRDIDKANLSYYDRISFRNEISYFSENLPIRYDDMGQPFVFTTYKPVQVLAMYLFEASNKPLIKTDKGHVSDVNSYCIILDMEIDALPENGFVSVYYKHNPEYHVIDLPHEIRASWVTDKKSGQLNKIELPVQAIVRRSHLIAMEKPNFDGSGVIYNEDV